MQVIRCDGYIPPSDNETNGKHWAVAHRLKTEDKKRIKEFVGKHSFLSLGVYSKRRVSLHIVLPKGKRRYDKTNCWKVILDSLVDARVILDDAPKWFEPGTITYGRDEYGEWHGTYIIVEDI